MEQYSHNTEINQNVYNDVLEHLKEKHIRLTETRKAIIFYIINAHHHPSAEQIYNDLLPQHPSMSLATVYNNLKVLIDEGFVVELKVSNDNTAYFDFMGHQHLHVVCESCGKITDFVDVDVSRIKEEAHEQTGYKITRAQLLIYGICPKCQEKNRQKIG
ncbi:peroxide-responsive transcriptional repressor PerR [Streptococcus macacae]|uniref:Ferric uptake regulator family protein n=1 Tax=Streptococcus macacae NCTC 11558 TaxID=764298 RepID=G5JVV9_9STRE|nr:peroxide-responsive transcriptional repressor PerR [Streptococcus macacae]EHJ53046.1 ferric uptake regulator family protein [Streptococcus macacae NCTC 11558]SUN78949.1 ferric uptake regulator protein FurR [Streptococcus macacae NCTC 11558]